LLAKPCHAQHPNGGFLGQERHGHGAGDLGAAIGKDCPGVGGEVALHRDRLTGTDRTAGGALADGRAIHGVRIGTLALPRVHAEYLPVRDQHQ